MKRLRLVLLALLSLTTPFLAVAQDLEPQEDWTGLQNEIALRFTAPPIKAHFADLDRELNISRRAPYTGAQRSEISARRQKERLKRQQVFTERKKREAVVRRLGRYGGDRAAHALIEIYERQLGYIEMAQRNVDRHAEALRTDINPGVDPGGVYWERWVRKHENPAALSVLADERKIRDLALAECAKILSPEVRSWLVRNAESHEWPEVREQMVAVLAGTADPRDAVVLGEILRKTPDSWLKVVILDALAANKCLPAAPSVLGALGDEAWPVQLAAIDAMRALDLRDAAAIDALVALMGESDGRVRYEARNALSAATGQSFGLVPEEWRLWWGANREGFEPLPQAAKVAELPEPPGNFCGRASASNRIAFIFPGGARMHEPAKRRETANDGSPAPEPAVDIALKIAAWELSEALQSFPEDLRFTVVVMDQKPQVWSKKLKSPNRDSLRSAPRFVLMKGEEGGGSVRTAVEAALALGVRGKTDDVALAEPGDIDTIYVLAGHSKGYERICRLRRVDLKWVSLPTK